VIKGKKDMDSPEKKGIIYAVVVVIPAAVAANPLKSFHFFYSGLSLIVSEFFYRVGQENLPIWPTWHRLVHNYLSSAGILIKLLVRVYVALFMA
jgi:hypothetical protein